MAGDDLLEQENKNSIQENLEISPIAASQEVNHESAAKTVTIQENNIHDPFNQESSTYLVPTGIEKLG